MDITGGKYSDLKESNPRRRMLIYCGAVITILHVVDVEGAPRFVKCIPSLPFVAQ